VPRRPRADVSCTPASWSRRYILRTAISTLPALGVCTPAPDADDVFVEEGHGFLQALGVTRAILCGNPIGKAAHSDTERRETRPSRIRARSATVSSAA
jgi:hypothetical protein